MDAEGALGPQVLVDAHALGGIAVHILHEPAGCVGANGDRSKVKRAKLLSDLLKQRRIGSVACEEKRTLRRAHCETAPQAGILVKRSPRGPVLRGGEDHFDVLAGGGGLVSIRLPPIELHTVCDAVAL